MTAIDLSRPRRVHLMGIGGAGMSGIAEILHSLGHSVSGSDAARSRTTDRLKELGVAVVTGHSESVDTSVEFVGLSTAIRPDNPERVAWEASGASIHHRFDLLEAVGAERRTLSVSGTHGKTTTSSMVVSILEAAGENPSYLVGATLAGRTSGSAWNESEWFVLEADESDSTFLAPPRSGAIVTNVEADHLDHHGSYERLEDAFVRFLTETQGPRIVCSDDPGAAALLQRVTATTYGTAVGDDYVVSEVDMDASGARWILSYGDIEEHSADSGPVPQRIELPLSITTAGLHLVLNASAAAALAIDLGIDPQAVQVGLRNWSGTSRRYEQRGEAFGITFRDDYAHLPTEVAAVLSTASLGGWNRIVAVLQPHRYGRTAEVASGFASALERADVVIVTEIYAAGEEPVAGVSSELVADPIEERFPSKPLYRTQSRSDLIELLVGELRAGDLCLTLGAGDITTLPAEVVAALTADREESTGGKS